MDELQEILNEMSELGFVFFAQWTRKKNFRVTFRETHRPSLDRICQHGIGDDFMDVVKDARERTLLFVSKVEASNGPDWHNRPFDLERNKTRQRTQAKARKATLTQ